MDLKWNDNGNWLVTASRDHLLKVFDLRNLSEEFQTFRGHKKEASAVAWHPIHEGLFASGGSDGSILFWNVGYVATHYVFDFIILIEFYILVPKKKWEALIRLTNRLYGVLIGIHSVTFYVRDPTIIPSNFGHAIGQVIRCETNTI